MTSSTPQRAEWPEPGRLAGPPPYSAERPSPLRKLSQLGPSEWRRRAIHMLPGLLPFLLWFFPHRDPLSPTLRWILVGVILALAVWAFVRYRRIARPGDRQKPAAVFGYAGSILIMLLVFPGQAELGLTVLAVLAFGDGSATLGGLLLGGPRLPWNPNKTWSGLASFVFVGAPLAAVIYWGETHFNPEALPPGGVPFATALICGGAATLAAALAESLPSRINDNIRVGLTAAATLALTHGWLVGWN